MRITRPQKKVELGRNHSLRDWKELPKKATKRLRLRLEGRLVKKEVGKA